MQMTLEAMEQVGQGGWAAVWPLVKDYLPLAAVAIAVVIPVSASFFGAWTAQRIADRNKFRDEITKEIRNTNAAISWASSVVNGAMAVKRQHILPAKADFDRVKAGFVEFVRRRRTGELQGNKEYVFALNLMNILPPRLPTESLQSLVLDKISVVGRPLHLAVVVEDSANSLRESIVMRNDRIAAMKEAGGLSKPGDAERYFGLPYDGGHVDQTTQHLLDSMVKCSEDVIFFAYLLGLDLQDHGKSLVEKFTKRLGKGAPNITSVDYSEPIAQGLIPPTSQYPDFMTKFTKHPEPPPARWKRLLRLQP